MYICQQNNPTYYKMKKIFLLLILFISIYSYSQDKFTVAEIGYMISPSNKYENSGISSNIGYLSGTLNFPVFSKGNTTFLAGFRGNMWTVNYNPEQIWPVNYYSLGLTLTYNRKLKNDNSFLFVLLPRYNSDLRHSSSEAWQLSMIKFGDDRMQLNPVINNGLFIEFTLSYKVDIPSD